MPTKAPSAGTKVTTGENIPVTREATGPVASGSLAAESTAEGGGFAANKPALEGQEQGRRRQPQQQPQHGRSTVRRTGAGDTSTSLGLENQQTSRGATTGDNTGGGTRHTRKTAGASEGPTTSSAQPATAPTYVASQYIRNPAGPHGKNLHEGGFEGSGTAEGALPEPGSMEDPGRAALGLGVGGTASSRKGMGGGGKEEEGTGSASGGEKTWYTALGDEDA
ncbi:uncharacterized protein C8A04DRAFT_38580 [Dichotomopilus funicola]|uniref:Uncharacterized protein n=1 Tax=Dichotomopilus funicola TaxID=1934379 RepID=A0AAN6V0B4_9PEZI|nr:hypothetical protein C8A04DRAFT_38580 [Dichotomopilus funicola]